jgi:hypothetical protein
MSDDRPLRSRRLNRARLVSCVPRHYIDEEADRDALFTNRNLVSVEYAADQLKVSPHTLEKTASRSQGPLLMWVFGSRGQLMRKYREVYIDMGPSPGPDLPHAWRGRSPEESLGEARRRHADPTELEGRTHARQ